MQLLCLVLVDAQQCLVDGGQLRPEHRPFTYWWLLSLCLPITCFHWWVHQAEFHGLANSHSCLKASPWNSVILLTPAQNRGLCCDNIRLGGPPWREGLFTGCLRSLSRTLHHLIIFFLSVCLLILAACSTTRAAFKLLMLGEFPGDLVIKTLHFQCWGRGFNPWSGN